MGNTSALKLFTIKSQNTFSTIAIGFEPVDSIVITSRSFQDHCSRRTGPTGVLLFVSNFVTHCEDRAHLAGAQSRVERIVLVRRQLPRTHGDAGRVD